MVVTRLQVQLLSSSRRPMRLFCKIGRSLLLFDTFISSSFTFDFYIAFEGTFAV